MTVKAIPDDYPRVSAYLCVDGATAAMEFYQQVFASQERMRIEMPDGQIGHAEITIGDSVIMISDPFPEMDVHAPPHFGGTPVGLSVYVEDADATVAKAVSLGAEVLSPLEDQFYGDRAGKIRDPWGQQWFVMTHIEDVSAEEVSRRAAAQFGG